jgi:hypothetical protein
VLGSGDKCIPLLTSVVDELVDQLHSPAALTPDVDVGKNACSIMSGDWPRQCYTDRDDGEDRSETSVFNSASTRLITLEHFSKFLGSEIFRSYIERI